MFTLTLKSANIPEKDIARIKKTVGRILEHRGCALCDGGYSVTLDLVPRGVGEAENKKDRYSIIEDGKGGALVTASDLCTVYAALGRFFMSGSFDFRGGFVPPTLPIEHEQKSSVRGMYLASHFYNFWHVAPMEDVMPFIEDLALWGCNTLMLCLAPQHYRSFKSPEAIEMADRLKKIFACAAEFGIAPALILFSNTGFLDRSEDIAAPWDMRGEYITANYAELHKEICPNLPGGMEEIRRCHREFFELFSDVPVKYFAYWAYDEGGCTCDVCSRWSENGFIKVYEESVKPLLSEYFPDAKLILSTWHFDRHLRDEGKRLYEKISSGKYPWAEYVMAVYGDGQFMPLTAEHGAPGGRPVIDFPEISMWGGKPWGGYGANPLTMRLDNFFSSVGDVLDGGFPYSEGFWENINEFCCMSHYSGTHADTADAVRDYVRFYFGISDTEPLLRAVELLEITLWRKVETMPDGRLRVTPHFPAAVREAYRLVTEADAVMTDAAKQDPRWRIIYLRAVIDYELYTHDFIPMNSVTAQKCFRELWALYHAYDIRIQPAVCPPLGR